MQYKYSKKQLFGKRLKVPKDILKQVYNCELSFEDFIKYNLEDKIPISCLKIPDRKIVERFGIEKSKTLDWELLSKDLVIYYRNDTLDYTRVSEVLLQIEPDVVNLNKAFYEKIKQFVSPKYYSEKMKEECPELIIDFSQLHIDNEYRKKYVLEGDSLWLYDDIIPNWELLKDKDLSYYLNKDLYNRYDISDKELKECMNKYGIIIRLLKYKEDVYLFIHKVTTLEDNELQEYLKKIVDSIIEKVGSYNFFESLTNEQYKELFKYTSLKEYLKKFNSSYLIDELFKELETLPSNYIFDTKIPISYFKRDKVLKLINVFGLKNIVDFNNECGHFFSRNDWNNLEDMYSLYATNYSTLYDKQFNARSGYDKEYVKEKFYEDIRKMIIYNSGGDAYSSILSSLKYITGDFREINHDLFILESAPDELKEAFYTRKLTPHLIAEHREYIPYLRGKNLISAFQPLSRGIKVINADGNLHYEKLDEYLDTNIDFDEFKDFIIEYRDVFDIFEKKNLISLIKIDEGSSLEEIKKDIMRVLRKAIVQYGAKYPNNIPSDLEKYYPNMVLPSDAPEELKEALYNRTINIELINSNPDYRKYLENMDFNVVFKYIHLSIHEEKRLIGQTTIAKAIERTFGHTEAFSILLQYGNYIEKCYKNEPSLGFIYTLNTTKDELLGKIDSLILENIINSNILYNDDMPSHFKDSNPTLFLDDNFSKEFKEKFYNRKITLKDFDDNPDLLKMFGNTNVVCGFSEELSWMIPLFSDDNNNYLANIKRLKVISEYLKINDISIQDIFKKYIQKNIDNIDMEKIEYITEVLFRLSVSNSSEMYKFRYELATQILNTDNPLDSLNKIEEIFIKNNLPTIGKIYSCFEMLHPNFKGFNFYNSMISPILKNKSNMGRKLVVFSDLIKASFGSNNRSVKSYIRNIRVGSELYNNIKNGKLNYDELDESLKQELFIFSNHLLTLYYNTLKGKKDIEVFYPADNVIDNIFELSKLLSLKEGKTDYNLADRVISMFCRFAGIDTLNEAENYIKTKIMNADSRNRRAALSNMVLEKGDFIKGINDIKYLGDILQNGSVAKEYLGLDAGSDYTPLDTDVSIITTGGTISEKINSTEASGYGNIWLVLRNDERFITTRDSNSRDSNESDLSKLEAFYTGVAGGGHYGIRTGFASSEINYIVVENYDYRIGLEIAMNGFYIPVANKEGKIVFTPDDYDKLRRKMSGLSYYDENNYLFSNNLITEETEYLASKIEDGNNEVRIKREKINNIISDSLDEFNLKLKTSIDGDLTEGFVELIDTGSTGRGTNKLGDGDFDFMMRLDNNILQDSNKLSELKMSLLRKFGKEGTNEITSNGDFRLKSVKLDDKTIVDIDITFVGRVDKITYSTDGCLGDRLRNIRNTNPEQYKYVVANILLAKQVLKEAGVYKPNRGEVPQGGLGGVGIENWILQNGGSFIDAANDFLVHAEGKSFDEFKNDYQIWDFGENHLSIRKNKYIHDNFVANNMSETGYNKMIKVLNEYLKNYNKNKLNGK